MGGFNLQDLMSQAKKQYEVLQKKMEETVVESSSGGGSVTVKMDGRKQVLAIKIDPEIVKAVESKDIHTVTLSYTFYPKEGPKPLASNEGSAEKIEKKL